MPNSFACCANSRWLFKREKARSLLRVSPMMAALSDSGVDADVHVVRAARPAGHLDAVEIARTIGDIDPVDRAFTQPVAVVRHDSMCFAIVEVCRNPGATCVAAN